MKSIIWTFENEIDIELPLLFYRFSPKNEFPLGKDKDFFSLYSQYVKNYYMLFK